VSIIFKCDRCKMEIVSGVVEFFVAGFQDDGFQDGREFDLCKPCFEVLRLILKVFLEGKQIRLLNLE